MIGIRLADHSVYPVFESDIPGGKRLVLTTARDNQDRVDIEMLRTGDGNDLARPLVSIGRLSLEDLRRHPGGEPDIELILQLSADGRLDVSARDPENGNATSRSIDLAEFDSPAYTPPPSLTDEFDPDVADTVYPEPRRRGAGLALVLVALLVILGAAAAIWWFVLRQDTTGSAPAPRSPVSATEQTESAETETATPEVTTPENGASPAVDEPAVEEPADTAVTPEPGSIEYRIRRGDTLWDISNSFYGTPWLFPELAEWNSIPDPDLIYADSELRIPDQLRREP
tara:strand:- start:970 stop:1824 length:855 start_codon:yes stop_codon:yes gene_type:complete